MDYEDIIKKTGWNGALTFHCAWYHDPYAIFWNNAKVVGGTIIGDWEDHKIIISEDVIGKVLGVKAEGLKYNRTGRMSFGKLLILLSMEQGGQRRMLRHSLNLPG